MLQLDYFNKDVDTDIKTLQKDSTKNIESFLNTKETLVVYHGSTEKVVEPLWEFCNSANDYGKGFYTSENEKSASDWVYSKDLCSGVVTKYILDLTNLKVKYLNDLTPIQWVATIIKYRGLGKNKPGDFNLNILNNLINNYAADLANYDVAIGYRGDDLYTPIIARFLTGDISLECVVECWKLGNLGEQVVGINENALNAFKFDSFYICNDKECAKSIQSDKHMILDIAHGLIQNSIDIKQDMTKLAFNLFDNNITSEESDRLKQLKETNTFISNF